MNDWITVNIYSSFKGFVSYARIKILSIIEVKYHLLVKKIFVKENEEFISLGTTMEWTYTENKTFKINVRVHVKFYYNLLSYFFNHFNFFIFIKVINKKALKLKNLNFIIKLIVYSYRLGYIRYILSIIWITNLMIIML